MPSTTSSSSAAGSSDLGIPPKTAAPATRPIDVITIEDDDEDDKENVPAPKRHVKRRMVRQISTAPSDVIDISDD
jgi:RecQ-mediated genome instability protein 1